MPNGGKGAIAKIYVETEVIDNFKQQAAKIKSGLGNGLKDLKDLDLKFGFDEKSMAEATSKELDAMMNIMTSKKLEKLDFSGIVPNMVSFLNDDSIADTVKLQIVQGLRQGLESFSSLASSVDIDTLARRDTKTVFSNILGYTAVQDILGSFDFTKQKSNLLNKQFNTTMGLSVGRNTEGFAQDVAQLLSLKATYDDPRYKEVTPYLISGTYRKEDKKNGGYKDVSLFKLQALSELLDPYVMQKRAEEGTLTPKVVEDIAGYLERMKYLGEAIQLKAKEGDPINDILDQYNSIVEDKNYAKFMEYIGNDPKLSAIFNTTRERVAEASRYKDTQYAQIDWRSFSTDINDVLARLIAGTGTNDVTSKLLSMVEGWKGGQKQFTADELLAETIKSFGIRSEDNGLRAEHDYAEQAEKAADRAEQAAGEAEAARDKAQEIANNISDKLGEIGDANPNDNSTSAPQGQNESGSPDDKSSTEGAATRAEGAAEESDAIVEGLQHEEESLDKATEEIREEREGVERARENYNEEINKIDERINYLEKKKNQAPKERKNYREFIDSLIIQRNEINSTLKEKATPNNYQESLDGIKNNIEQLKESEKAFKEIETQFDALDNKDISVKANQIRVEYEKRLADLQRAAYAYNRSKENAMQFDEYNEQDVQELLNQAGYDSTKGFLGQDISTQQLQKALKQRMKELKQQIPGKERYYKDREKYDEIRLQEQIDELKQRRNSLTQELQQQAEIDRMIAEAETREQQAPPTTPATIQEKSSAPVSSGQAGEESPVVQNLEQQIKEVEQTIKTVEIKQKELLAKKEELNKLLGEYGKETNNIFYLTDSTEETSQYWQKAGSATKDPTTGAAKQLKEKGQAFQETINTIKEQEKLLSTLDKESDGYQQAEQKLQQLRDKKSRDWLAFYRAHEQLDYWVGKEEGNTKAKQTLNKWTPEKMGLENLGFSQENLDKMIADVKGQVERLAQMRTDIAAYQEQYNQLQDEINILNAKRDNLIAESKRAKPAETKPPQSTNAGTPLSSSGTETASSVQEEGNEANDAAGKMQALAQAKKEALEANKQLAESANVTQEAILAESSAGDFNTLILALTEIYELLSQLPQSFEGFKGFDLTGFTEPLNSLSETINNLPKEGFNISLGDSFDNLADRINEVLQKIQELSSQAKTTEIESNIAEKYDGQIKQLNEQINQLKIDAEEAKKALAELQTIKQNNTVTPIKTETKTQKDVPKIDPLAEEYKSLKQAQENVFKATNVEEYNTALKEAEDILQRIINTLQSRVTEQSPLLQTDYLIQGYGEDPYDAISTEALNKSVLQKANIENMQTASAKGVQAFVEQQKKALQSLEDSLKDIELIPVEERSDWDQKYIDKYASIARSAEEATTVIQILKDTLAQIETTGLDQNTLQSFLEFEQYGLDQIATVQTENSAFNSNTKTIANGYVSKLTEIEKRLEKIKSDSGKLINVDSTTSNALIFVEKYLNRIKELKEAINKDPLEAYKPSFTERVDSTFTELVNTKDKDSGQSMLEEMEQISARSQADFKRMTTNYGSYATALKKLFDDMSKGAGVSLKQLEEDLNRVNELAVKLANSTGLEQNNLLTGELNPKADPKVADAQAGAANKVAIAYESMFTKIESEARTAQSTIEGIFGIEGVAKGLDARFVEGSVKGFNDFVQNANQAGEALKRLKEIQENIGNDKNWATQEENVKEYQQTVETLNESLKQVAENASKFSVTDELDVQKLRASATQFIKDNPALSGGDVSQLEGYIDQLQGKINSVDFTAIKNGIEGVKQTAIEAGRTGDTFFSMLTQRFKSLGAYLLSFVSFYEVIGVFKEGINIVHELDDALTEMQKVSDESLSSLREYQKGTFDTADKIGTTAAQLQQSTADWMRLGEDLQTASQSAQTANVLFNVSEFDNINDATTALVAMSAAYADAEKGIEKMDIVDRLNLIGNNYAIATDELATALQDGAATLQTAGKQHCQNL